MSTFYNGANCDIYIGNGAGTKLMKEIKKAQKSVKIVSPYLSPDLIKELLSLNKEGIQVHLITSDDIEDYFYAQKKQIHELIIQNQSIDEESQKKRNNWIKYSKIILAIIILLSITSISILIYTKLWNIGYVFIPICFLFLIYCTLKHKIKNKKIFTYSYSKLFPFKVYISPYADKTNDSNSMFIHSKIYIIDDKIAYLGSLNFTESGTKRNYETRIRTEDYNAIKKILEEFDSLFHDSNIPERSLESWGRKLYREPIN